MCMLEGLLVPGSPKEQFLGQGKGVCPQDISMVRGREQSFEDLLSASVYICQLHCHSRVNRDWNSCPSAHVVLFDLIKEEGDPG